MKTIFKYLCFSMLMNVIVSCNSVYTRIYSNYDRSADFKSYKTFAWLHDNDTGNSPYNNEVIRNNIRNYFTHSLAERGYKTNLDTPDILLELIISNVKKEEFVSNYFTPYSDFYSPYLNPFYYPFPNPYFYTGFFSNWNSYMTNKIEYTESTITLNIIDRKLNKLVWTGSAEGDIDNPKYISENLHPAVYKILNKYPVKPVKTQKQTSGSNKQNTPSPKKHPEKIKVLM